MRFQLRETKCNINTLHDGDDVGVGCGLEYRRTCVGVDQAYVHIPRSARPLLVTGQSVPQLYSIITLLGLISECHDMTAQLIRKIHPFLF